MCAQEHRIGLQVQLGCHTHLTNMPSSLELQCLRMKCKSRRNSTAPQHMGSETQTHLPVAAAPHPTRTCCATLHLPLNWCWRASQAKTHGPDTWKPSALISASSSEHVSQSKHAPSVLATCTRHVAYCIQACVKPVVWKVPRSGPTCNLCTPRLPQRPDTSQR